MKPVPFLEIRGELWEWVRAGLLHTAKKTGQNYTPEDVYLMLHARLAHLYVIGERQGFAVLKRDDDPDGPVLFVFAINGPQELEPLKPQLYAELEKIGASIGAKRARMQGRKGWESETYWKPKAVIFEHEF